MSPIPNEMYVTAVLVTILRKRNTKRFIKERPRDWEIIGGNIDGMFFSKSWGKNTVDKIAVAKLSDGGIWCSYVGDVKEGDAFSFRISEHGLVYQVIQRRGQKILREIRVSQACGMIQGLVFPIMTPQD